MPALRSGSGAGSSARVSGVSRVVVMVSVGVSSAAAAWS